MESLQSMADMAASTLDGSERIDEGTDETTQSATIGNPKLGGGTAVDYQRAEGRMGDRRRVSQRASGGC